MKFSIYTLGVTLALSASFSVFAASGVSQTEASLNSNQTDRSYTTYQAEQMQLTEAQKHLAELASRHWRLPN